jgi:PAS domain S-box-containing protein
VGEAESAIQATTEELRTTGFKTIETRHRRKDGSTFPVEINIQYVELEQSYLLAVVRDITDRRQMEEMLRESEAKFRTLFEVANDANLILHNGVFVDCNAKALELFGATRDQVFGQCPSHFSPQVQPNGSSSIAEAKRHMEATLAGQPQFFEWQHQRLDGRAIDTDISLSRFELGGETYIQAIIRDISGRKEVEKQLTWKTAFFEAQVHSAIDGILIVDGEGRKILQNQQMRDLWNIPPGFFEDQNDQRQREWVANQTKHPQQFLEKVTYLYAHPDEISHDEIDLISGQCFDRYSAPVKGQDGKYYGRIWSFRDVTERKQAEEARRTSEARYRTLFDYAPDGIVIADPDGTYLDGNASICRMLDCSHKELVGRNASDIVIESEIPQISTALLEIKAASGHHREWQFRRHDGSVFPAEVIATRMPDGNLLAMIRDLTERKQADEQISQQAAFLDKAQDAIFVRDLKGKLLFWNMGAERMYGWVRQEVVGRNMDELLYTQPEKLKEAYELTVRSGEWHGELQHFTKDGSELVIESRWTLIRDNAGHPKSVLAINTDITEKKMIEAQFMRAQRMESIGTLAGGIAHDLNNILAPIVMSIDILKTMSENPQAMKILETIEVSAKRGADIVRQVLSFARGLEGERVEVQAKHLLNDIESIIKDTFPKDIRLKFSVPNEIWTILGDPTQIHQILLNLCVNARDAMPNGGNLTIKAENSVLDEHYAAMNIQAKAGRYVQITVSDSGTGIPPSLLEKIFEPFFTTKAINKGTGLGLSTVAAIVKSHGGIINVYSEPNKGTTFKVYLPALEISCEARKAQLAHASLPRGNGETVLLVDDEASIITITSQTLQAFGYDVLTATDGAEAVAVYAVHNAKIAVVLTDMAMPIMDGAATIRALTKINPAIKIIAASGLNANEDMTKASGAGIRHFLTKPYTAGTLLKTLRTILEES